MTTDIISDLNGVRLKPFIQCCFIFVRVVLFFVFILESFLHRLKTNLVLHSNPLPCAFKQLIIYAGDDFFCVSYHFRTWMIIAFHNLLIPCNSQQCLFLCQASHHLFHHSFTQGCPLFLLPSICPVNAKFSKSCFFIVSKKFQLSFSDSENKSPFVSIFKTSSLLTCFVLGIHSMLL